MVRYSSIGRGFPAGNPIASALVIIIGSLVIAASIVVGFFAFVILASVLLVVAAVVSVRLWWFRRKMASDPAFQAARNGRPGGSQETIEGEYRVVVEERDHRRD
jgi:membrane protein implicated in regulation of membrane protease activity